MGKVMAGYGERLLCTDTLAATYISLGKWGKLSGLDAFFSFSFFFFVSVLFCSIIQNLGTHLFPA